LKGYRTFQIVDLIDRNQDFVLIDRFLKCINATLIRRTSGYLKLFILFYEGHGKNKSCSMIHRVSSLLNRFRHPNFSFTLLRN
jgi:hypothetical protein